MQQTLNHWYVQVSGQSYGPYSVDQMRGFISEGRVIASSLISQDAVQGFAMAAAFPTFAPLLAPKAAPLQPAAPSQPQAQPHNQPLQLGRDAQINPQNTAAVQPSPEPKTVTVFLIMAEIRSDQAMPFLQALQAYGTAQRIGDTVWLLRSDVPLPALHGALSASLTRQDRLFILDSFANKTAWSNIGADMDVRIREMWGVA